MKSLAVFAVLAAAVAAAPQERRSPADPPKDDKQTTPNDAELFIPSESDFDYAVAPPVEQWFVEVIVETDMLNFGTLKPEDVIRKLGDPDVGMCDPNAPRCDKRVTKKPFKTHLSGKTKELDLYPEIEESNYSGRAERDGLIELLAAAYANITVEKDEGGPVTGGKAHYAPSRITVRRRSTEGARGSEMEVKFWVVGGPGPTAQKSCDTIMNVHSLSKKLTFDDVRYKAITEVLGMVSTCCEDFSIECLGSKALQAGQRIWSSL